MAITSAPKAFAQIDRVIGLVGEGGQRQSPIGVIGRSQLFLGAVRHPKCGQAPVHVAGIAEYQRPQTGVRVGVAQLSPSASHLRSGRPRGPDISARVEVAEQIEVGDVDAGQTEKVRRRWSTTLVG
jgi:hypothetical protein